MGHLEAIYSKSNGRIAPSGWTCKSLPYLVEVDNSGCDKDFRGRSDNPTKIWPWGWDETICDWNVEPGKFEIMAGHSSEDISLEKIIKL